MEIKKYHHHFCGKDCLIKVAVNTLNRLNSTISEIKRWSPERAVLDDDVWHLQKTLPTFSNTIPSVILSRDILVKHQSDEIQRLTTANDCMRMKLKSMSNALLETEQTIAWAIDKKVKDEMERINRQVTDERLQLARQITRLRKQLEDTDANATLRQIKSELCKFAEGDKKLDQYLSQVTTKVIHAINGLSNKLIIVNETLEKSESEKIQFQNESIHLKCLLTEKNINKFQLENYNCLDEEEIQQVNFQAENIKLDKFETDCIAIEKIKNIVKRLEEEKELLLREKIIKEKALMRNISGVKTKLAIALMKNEKLNEKIELLESNIIKKSSMVKIDLSMQTEGEVEQLQSLLELTSKRLATTNDRLILLEEKQCVNNRKELESELIRLKEQNNEVTTQLVMERTTAEEALKECERSVKQIERLEAELEDMKLERITLKKDIVKIKMENCELRDAKMIYKKKNMILGEEGMKERESLQIKVRHMKMRINKLMGDLKIAENKSNKYSETIRELEEEKTRLHEQVDILIIGLEETIQDSKKIHLQNSTITNTMKKLELEKEKYTVEHDRVVNELKNYQRQLDSCKIENNNLNDLLCKSNKLNKELRSTCQQDISKIQILTDQLSIAEKDCKELKIRIETMSSTISSLEHNNTEMKKIIDNCRIENNQLKADRTIIDKKTITLEEQLEKLQDEMKNQSIVKYSKVPKTILKNEISMQTIEESEEMIKSKFATKTFNEFISDSERKLLKNLEDTDKELQSVKNELANVRHKIGYIRTDLDNGKFGLKSITTENHALKKELVKLRKEKYQLESTVRELGKYCK